MCVSVCVSGCMCIVQMLTLVAFLCHFLSCIFKTALSQNLELASSAKLAIQWAPRLFVSPFGGRMTDMHVSLCLVSHMELGVLF